MMDVHCNTQSPNNPVQLVSTWYCQAQNPEGLLDEAISLSQRMFLLYFQNSEVFVGLLRQHGHLLVATLDVTGCGCLYLG